MSPEMELITQGLVLMVVGMSSVFALLATLVAVLNASARFFDSWPLDNIPAQAQASNRQNDELELIAIALAAAKRSRG